MVINRNRVMIIGQPGSGKSTLTRRLADILKLPAEHIDLIHWQSGWIERERDEKDLLCAEVHAKDQWIFEGGHSRTWPERLQRADTLIWLDFPLPVRAWRVLKRRIQYHGKSRPDVPQGCPEHVSLEFVRFIWRTRNTNRRRMRQFYNAAPVEKETYRLRSRVEVEEFVANLEI